MHYGQNKKDKRTNKENTTEKTKNRVTRTSLKSGDELMCSGEVGTINHKKYQIKCNTNIQTGKHNFAKSIALYKREIYNHNVIHNTFLMKRNI